MGYRLAMVSNAADDANTQVLVDKLGARPYVEFVLSSAAQGIRKPNPLIFLFALGRMGVAPERAVMVGDTLGADILGAHNSGMFAVWVTRRADRPANRAHAATIQPDAQVDRLSELPGADAPAGSARLKKRRPKPRFRAPLLFEERLGLRLQELAGS